MLQSESRQFLVMRPENVIALRCHGLIVFPSTHLCHRNLCEGTDPKIGSDLEFFAPQVDYFGEKKVNREKIRRDLLHYDRRWPEAPLMAGRRSSD